MIRSRHTTKNCDICNRVVAVKKNLRFVTMVGYVTLRKDCACPFEDNSHYDVHICDDCWEGMQDAVRKALKLKEG